MVVAYRRMQAASSAKRNRVKDAGGSHENPPAIRTGDALVSTASFQRPVLTKEPIDGDCDLDLFLAVAVLIAAREQRRGRTLERLLQRVLSEDSYRCARRAESYVVDHHQHNHGVRDRRVPRT